ncbi:hypothetical protein GGI17_005354 [Coemansia sp. S146]|nr:hypothetical protein GGI17_005354 [Coemansia sp. S146]
MNAQISKPLFGRGASLSSPDDAFVAPWRTVDRETYELREELYKAQCEATAFDQRQLKQEETTVAKAPVGVDADNTVKAVDTEKTAESAPSGPTALAGQSSYESVFVTARKLAERRATGAVVAEQASYKGKEADRSLSVDTFDEEDEEDDNDFEPDDAEGEDDEEEVLQRDMEPIDEAEEVTTPAASAYEQSSVATSSAASPSNSQPIALTRISPSQESEPASELSVISEASDQSIELSVVEESSGDDVGSASESDESQEHYEDEDEDEVVLPASIEEPLESESPSESEAAVETESEPERAEVAVEVLEEDDEEEENAELDDLDAVGATDETEASDVEAESDVGSVDDESDQMTEEITTMSSSSDDLSESEAEAESEAAVSEAAESEAEESVAESSGGVAAAGTNESAPLSPPRSWWPFSGRSLFSGLGSAQKDQPRQRPRIVHEAVSDSDNSSPPRPVKRKSDELLVVDDNQAQTHYVPPTLAPSAYARRRLPQRTVYMKTASPYVPASFIDVSNNGGTVMGKRMRGPGHSELSDSASLANRRHTSNTFTPAATPSDISSFAAGSEPLSKSPKHASAMAAKRANIAMATPTITAASLGLEARRSVARGRCQQLRRQTSVYYGSGYGSHSAPYTLNVALSAPKAVSTTRPVLTASAQETNPRDDGAGPRGGSITAQKILDIIGEVPPTRSQMSLESHDVINPYELSSPYSVRMRPATTQRRRVLVPLSTRLSQSSSADSAKTVTQHTDDGSSSRAILESIQSAAPPEVQAGLGSALKAIQPNQQTQKRYLPPPLPTKKSANAPSPSAKKSAGAAVSSQSPGVASPNLLTKTLSSTSPSSLSTRLAAKGQLAPKPLDQLAKDSTTEPASQAPRQAFSLGVPKPLPKATRTEGVASTPQPPVKTLFSTPVPATKTAEVLPPKALETAVVPAVCQMPTATTTALATSELQLPVFSFVLPTTSEAVGGAAAKQKAEKLDVSQLPTFAFTLDIKAMPTKGSSLLSSKLMLPSTQASTGDWACDVCDLKSPLSATKCVVCDAARPAIKPAVAPSAPPATNSWANSSFKPVAPKDGEWVCDTCELKNPLAATKCTVCDSAKSGPKPVAAAPAAAPVSNLWAQSGFTIAGPKNGEWTCDTCELKNGAAATKCTVCDSAKPGPSNPVTIAAAAPVAAPVSNLWAQSGFTIAGPKDGEWTCDTCELKNGAAATKCTVCDAAKPGPSNPALVAAAAAPVAAPVPNLWAQSGFQPQAPKDGQWTCDTCELKNGAAATRCTVCDAAKPAQKSDAPSTSSAMPLAKKKASDLDVSQLPVFTFDLDVSKRPAFPRC